jgi:hypothetical protein
MTRRLVDHLVADATRPGAWMSGSIQEGRRVDARELIRDFKTDTTFIITRSDVIRVLTQVRGERGAAAR